MLTGIYVLRANREYDELTRAIVDANAREASDEAASSHRAPLRRSLALAAGAARAAERGEPLQATNWNAIIIFAAFVLLTLGITYWAAQRTRTTKDFYAAGGGVTGFQNGLAIAGDYMSAASFLGISALVYSCGYYGLIYSIGFLVGWPIIMFLMAEPLRNLGRFTFADVASYRLQATPIRAMAATGTLVTVAFYLIAQMVGAGQLIQLLFGLPYLYAVVIVGVLMIIYVTFGGMIATTWVQIIKAGLLLGGATLMSILVLAQFGFDFNALIAKAVEVHPKHDAIMLPGAAGRQPDLGDLARHGADVRHRGPAAHPDALLHGPRRQGSAQVGVLGDHLHRLFLHPDLHHRLRRDRAGADRIRSITSAATSRARCSAAATCRRSISRTPSAAT